MQYSSRYLSPLGQILLTADDLGLSGLWFAGQKYFPDKVYPEKALPVFDRAKRWLDLYFTGRQPVMDLPLHCSGTPFQLAVWNLLRVIPYGETVTYGDLARQLGSSARAVGNAVGRNKFSILIPCHRVLGVGGSLTGYAGGTDRKRALLGLEGVKIP